MSGVGVRPHDLIRGLKDSLPALEAELILPGEATWDRNTGIAAIPTGLTELLIRPTHEGILDVVGCNACAYTMSRKLVEDFNRVAARIRVGVRDPAVATEKLPG